VQVNAGQIISELKGVDIPSSTVVIGLQRVNTGNIEEVEWLRMANTRIADKSILVELLLKLRPTQTPAAHNTCAEMALLVGLLCA